MAFTKATFDYLDSGGLINWQLTAQTANFPAVSGEGYLVDTSSAAITVTLPTAPSAGDEIIIVDYASNAGTNNITLDPGTLNLRGATDDLVLSTNNQTARLLYSGATKGWLVTTEAGAGSGAADAGPYNIDYLLVAGGGGGGNNDGGGGGAGGLLESTILSISTGNTLTISVGGGGAGAIPGTYLSSDGTDSTITSSAITTITAYGGGRGQTHISNISDSAGGSGGGANQGSSPGGAGVSGQGNDGGIGSGAPNYAGGGGGGAGAVGSDGTSSAGGAGGVGATTTIISTSNATISSVGEIVSSSLYFAGGGGAGEEGISGNAYGVGGYGGGGDGNSEGDAENGTPNTGGGGGGAGYTTDHYYGGSGGSGVCILKMPTASYSETTTGTPDVYIEGSYTVLVYKSGGTYTT